jgi:hypothetical protein
MQQHHHGEADQVGLESLLHLKRRSIQALADAVEGRQVSVYRERAERGQRGQQCCKPPKGFDPVHCGLKLCPVQDEVLFNMISTFYKRGQKESASAGLNASPASEQRL